MDLVSSNVKTEVVKFSSLLGIVTIFLHGNSFPEVVNGITMNSCHYQII